MQTRERVLEITAELLAASPNADVSTRAVCEAAGIGAPLIYRQFGDKNGLLAAVVDHAFGRYLAAKRALTPSSDPVADLHAGWDAHSAFAMANPNIYRLMFAASSTAAPAAVEESFELLRDILERCAAAGRLRISVLTAARMVMAANVGVALSLIARPAQYPGDEVSHRLRDAVFAAVLVEEPASGPSSQITTETEPQAAEPGTAGPLASTLAVQVHRTVPAGLSPGEQLILQEILGRIADSR